MDVFDKRITDNTADLGGYVLGAALLGAGMFFLSQIGGHNNLDHDVFHEMALFREILRTGQVPLADQFAYTPTIYPVVHHEWGTGAILYLVSTRLGAGGVMLLKGVLTMIIVAAGIGCARRRGASWPVLICMTPLAAVIGHIGFSTIRAQLFSLCMVAILLNLLDQDRHGSRRWLLWWIPLHVVWVNLHAGFIVGLGFFGLHIIEQAVRRQPIRHLLLAGAALLVLVLANPYGVPYLSYLWKGLSLNRSLILEWQPLYRSDHEAWPVVFLLAVGLLAYSVKEIGPRKMPGLLLMVAAGYEAVMHVRHISLFAVAWLCYAPGFVTATPLGRALTRICCRHRFAFAAVWLIVAAVNLPSILAERFWELRIPTDRSFITITSYIYPVGVESYLRDAHFRGNVMVPFRVGAYLSWKLWPDVKVSLDGRYEVAFQHGMLDENFAFYSAMPGWEQMLGKYATDVVLVPNYYKLAPVMPLSGWPCVYKDDIYDVYARPGIALPFADRRGTPLVAAFP